MDQVCVDPQDGSGSLHQQPEQPSSLTDMIGGRGISRALHCHWSQQHPECDPSVAYALLHLARARHNATNSCALHCARTWRQGCVTEATPSSAAAHTRSYSAHGSACQCSERRTHAKQRVHVAHSMEGARGAHRSRGGALIPAVGVHASASHHITYRGPIQSSATIPAYLRVKRLDQQARHGWHACTG